MKIDVLQVGDVTFRPYRYWSDWIDVFAWNCVHPYLVQMKVSRCNGKKFRSINIKGHWMNHCVAIPKDLMGPVKEG